MATMRRVSRLERLALTEQEGGITVIVMAAGYSDRHPDPDSEVPKSALLPKSGLIVLRADEQVASGQSR